jgi:DNA-binding GntR family transcriptional regulator
MKPTSLKPNSANPAPAPQASGSALGPFIAKDQVLEFIRNRILEGQYKAGQYLSESILQTHLLEANLDFSRVPIREALVALRAEKLVEIVPKRGTFICKVTPDVLKEILRARWIIEQHVARELALNPDIDLHEAQALNDEIALLSQGDYSDEARFKFDRLDREFHCTLCALAGFGTTFTELLRTMRNRFRLILFPRDRSLHAGISATVVREHQAILNAIRPRKRTARTTDLAANARRAEAAVRKHLRNALTRWELSLPDKDRIRRDLPDLFGTHNCSLDHRTGS